MSRREMLQELGVAGAGMAMLPGLVAAQEFRTTSSHRIRIGQIGVGHAHASKLAVYRASSEYDVVGICEPNETLRNRASGQTLYQGLPWMTQDQLLNVPGLDAVLVETEVRHLLDVAEACVRAGKHVHIDKPAGESLPQFRRLLDTAARKKLLVQMGYMYRYNPGIVLLREFLERGWLGDVFEVHTVMSKVVGTDDRKGLAAYPGGILFELGGHVLDTVIRILGRPKKVQGYNQHVSEREDGLLDNMLTVLQYPKALATVKVSAMEVEGFERRHLVVCGTEGTFHIQPLDNPSVRLSLSKDRGERYRRGTQQVALPKYQRYVGDAEDMAKILRGEKSSDFSYAHDLLVQTTLLQACGLSLHRR